MNSGRTSSPSGYRRRSLFVAGSLEPDAKQPATKNEGRRYLLALLIAAIAATRYLFRSHFLYDIDSVNFGLALQRFSPASYQPHPPGYFLYVMLGKLAQTVIPDANAALVAISIAASCGAAAVIYLLTREWYGRGAAMFSVLLFLFSPLCWFHGTVALTYIVEAFFSGLVGLLCWKTYRGEVAYAVPAAAAYALAAGFRPSAAMLLAPILAAALLRVPVRRRWIALAAAAGVLLAWFVPMIAASGGVEAYFGPLAHLWRMVPGRRTTMNNPALAVARLAAIGALFVLCFGSASLLFLAKPADRSEAARDIKRFTFIWTIPGLLFFTFVFLNFVNGGYLLILCPPVFAYLGARAYRLWGRPWFLAATGAAMAANVAIFLWAPVYCSNASVRRFEREMAAIARDFSNSQDPQETLIVGFDSHFLGYRHAGYYLPDFVTVQYPEVAFPDGKRVFLMHGRDTRITGRFDAGRFERFVFFPLPDGGEYGAYVDRVRGSLPPGALTTLKIGGRTVLAGPSWVLPILFPSTAGRGMYTSLDASR